MANEQIISQDTPFDPEAILEVRNIRKCFPLKKTITGKVIYPKTIGQMAYLKAFFQKYNLWHLQNSVRTVNLFL